MINYYNDMNDFNGNENSSIQNKKYIKILRY